MSTKHVFVAGALTMLGLLAAPQAWAGTYASVPQEEVVQDGKNPKPSGAESTLQPQAGPSVHLSRYDRVQKLDHNQIYKLAVIVGIQTAQCSVPNVPVCSVIWFGSENLLTASSDAAAKR